MRNAECGMRISICCDTRAWAIDVGIRRSRFRITRSAFVFKQLHFFRSMIQLNYAFIPGAKQLLPAVFGEEIFVRGKLDTHLFSELVGTVRSKQDMRRSFHDQ